MKANLAASVATTLVTVGAVYVLTEYGIAKGMPGPFSFALVLAALFGVLYIKLRA